mmetsp:Transcript_7657/g.13191  ORF Transcript_7657/g.13191 Transcript_7657/m.13191 type:complete len:247 (-) Transcript_7657:429-1169(-)
MPLDSPLLERHDLSFFRQACSGGTSISIWIMSLGWSWSPLGPFPALGSPGSESKIHTSIAWSVDAGICRNMSSATLPPKLWPMMTFGVIPVKSMISHTPAEHERTVGAPIEVSPCRQLDGPMRCAEWPWQGRSGSTNFHCGNSLARCCANGVKVLPEPKMPCRRTAVGGLCVSNALAVFPSPSSFETRESQCAAHSSPRTNPKASISVGQLCAFLSAQVICAISRATPGVQRNGVWILQFGGAVAP